MYSCTNFQLLKIYLVTHQNYIVTKRYNWDVDAVARVKDGHHAEPLASATELLPKMCCYGIKTLHKMIYCSFHVCLVCIIIWGNDSIALKVLKIFQICQNFGNYLFEMVFKVIFMSSNVLRLTWWQTAESNFSLYQIIFKSINQQNGRTSSHN